MLDLKTIRQDPDAVTARLIYRLRDRRLIRTVVATDGQRRAIVAEVEGLKADRNKLSSEIAERRGTGDASELMDRARALGDQVRKRETELRRIEEQLREHLLRIPNLPDPTVPSGRDSKANVVARCWGEPRTFSFQPRPHWEVGAALGLDLERGARIAGTRFYVLQGQLAMLEMALAAFMMDLHITNHDYTPVIPPNLINRSAMERCGQLPKFAKQLYRTSRDGLYLIPTAESSLASLHAGEVLSAAELPLKYVGFSPCYRREAGAAGKDTRGIIRVHQFHKVELFKYTTPETSNDELELMVNDAEEVLRHLGLPYQVVLLSSGDMGFAASKTYDLEVWLPGQPAGNGRVGSYREISSCSNCTDFQARRGDIRYRPTPGGRPEYVHMLNGSGLAIGRTMIAILENFQEEDGTVNVPMVLRPYLGGCDRLIPGRCHRPGWPHRLSPANGGSREAS